MACATEPRSAGAPPRTPSSRTDAAKGVERRAGPSPRPGEGGAPPGRPPPRPGHPPAPTTTSGPRMGIPDQARARARRRRVRSRPPPHGVRVGRSDRRRPPPPLRGRSRPSTTPPTSDLWAIGRLVGLDHHRVAELPGHGHRLGRRPHRAAPTTGIPYSARSANASWPAERSLGQPPAPSTCPRPGSGRSHAGTAIVPIGRVRVAAGGAARAGRSGSPRGRGPRRPGSCVAVALVDGTAQIGQHHHRFGRAGRPRRGPRSGRTRRRRTPATRSTARATAATWSSSARACSAPAKSPSVSESGAPDVQWVSGRQSRVEQVRPTAPRCRCRWRRRARRSRRRCRPPGPARPPSRARRRSRRDRRSSGTRRPAANSSRVSAISSRSPTRITLWASNSASQAPSVAGQGSRVGSDHGPSGHRPADGQGDDDDVLSRGTVEGGPHRLGLPQGLEEQPDHPGLLEVEGVVEVGGRRGHQLLAGRDGHGESQVPARPQDGREDRP